MSAGWSGHSHPPTLMEKIKPSIDTQRKINSGTKQKNKNKNKNFSGSGLSPYIHLSWWFSYMLNPPTIRGYDSGSKDMMD